MSRCYQCGRELEHLTYTTKFSDSVTCATVVMCKTCWDSIYNISVRQLMSDYDDPNA